MLGTALLTVLLYHETSARVLTMAWSIEAAAILVFGFVAHERAIGWAGTMSVGSRDGSERLVVEHDPVSVWTDSAQENP